MNSFPNRVTPPELKDDKYTLKIAKAIEDYYNTNGDLISESNASEFRLNRLYARGEQPKELYEDWMKVKLDGETKERVALNQINYDIVPVAPKIRNQVIEMMLKNSGNFNVIFSDEMSSLEKKKKKASLKAEADIGGALDQISQKMGVQRPKKEYLPKDVKDLNMYEQSGGIRIQEEIAFENALNLIYEGDLDWSKYNAPELLGWLFDVGIAGEIQFVDPNTKKLKTRVINWENAVIENSPRWDYADSEFFGEYVPMSILDIHKSVYETTGRKISEDDWNKMMAKNVNKVSKKINYLDYASLDGDFYESPFSNSTLFDGFHVRVLDFMYLCTDVERVKGTKRVPIKKPRKNEINSGKVKSDGRGGYYKEIKDDTNDVYLKRWRRGKWVVGTDIVFDYGLAFDQIIDDGMPVTPFKVFRLQTKCPIQLMRPHLDEFHKDWLEIQNLKASAFGNILAIDTDRIFDALVGGKSIDKKDLAKSIRLSNFTMYSSESLDPRRSNAGKPIDVINGGMGSLYMELIQDIEFQRNMIYESTGLSPVALGSRPESGETLGQTEISVNAAANAVGSLYRGFKSIKEKSAYNALLYVQYIIKEYKDTPYKYMIGEGNYNVIKKIKTDVRKMSVQVREMMTNLELQEINRLIEIALAGGKNGNAGITVYQVSLLKSMIQDGKPFKLISLMLKHYQEEEAKKNQEEQMKMIQAQSAEVMKQQQAAAQADAQEKQMDVQGKSGLQQQDKDLALRNELAILEAEKKNNPNQNL
jgi:hypothetical protein